MIPSVAFTLKTLFHVSASSVVALLVGAMIDNRGAIGPLVTLLAPALAVDAHLVIGTRYADALVDGYVASLTLKASGTLANEFPPGSRHKRARAVIQARICRTGVVFPLAIGTHKIDSAVARVIVLPVYAGTPIFARLRVAVVNGGDSGGVQ